METDQIAGRIERLEQEIEDLAAAAERSRRIILASRGALAAGLAWLAAGLLGVVTLDGTGLVFSLAAIIGGIVFMGSSGSSLDEAKRAMARAEETRSALIDTIDPDLVEPVPLGITRH